MKQDALWEKILKDIKSEGLTNKSFSGNNNCKEHPTNTCTKCGYHNEYMDPIPKYICYQCKTRKESWS